MEFKDFISTLTQQEVDEFWENTDSAPQDAIDRNWKYSLKKNNKLIPEKWFVSQLATKKGVQVDFQRVESVQHSSMYQTHISFKEQNILFIYQRLLLFRNITCKKSCNV